MHGIINPLLAGDHLSVTLLNKKLLQLREALAGDKKQLGASGLA